MASCFCGQEIPQERVELGFNTCVKHSGQSPHVGFMTYGHKTAGEVTIISSSNPENVRIARRAYERKR